MLCIKKWLVAQSVESSREIWEGEGSAYQTRGDDDKVHDDAQHGQRKD